MSAKRALLTDIVIDARFVAGLGLIFAVTTTKIASFRYDVCGRFGCSVRNNHSSNRFWYSIHNNHNNGRFFYNVHSNHNNNRFGIIFTTGTLTIIFGVTFTISTTTIVFGAIISTMFNKSRFGTLFIVFTKIIFTIFIFIIVLRQNCGRQPSTQQQC